MKRFFLLLFAISLSAQESAPPKADLLHAGVGMETGAKSLIVIEPKARASDLIDAFDFLRKDRPTYKIALRTVEAMFPSVADLSATTNGTLLLVKILSNQGARTQIVPIEQVLELSYSP